MSYLECILKFFTEMRIDLLHIGLKEEYTYQDTTKEIFLNKLEKLFISHANACDSELLVYPGQCTGKECENCSRKGYRFVGNHSKKYIDFVFITEGDDIKDIFSCSEFSADVELEKLSRIDSFYFDFDERVTFYKSAEYWSKVSAAETAFSEIISSPPRFLEFEEFCYWLEKYSELNTRIGKYNILKPNMKWTPFSRLYADLQKYRSCLLDYESGIQKAISTMNLLDNEKRQIDWVLNHERLFEEVPYDFKFNFRKEGEFYILEKFYSIILMGERFQQLYNFIGSYMEYHKALLEKHNTYELDELKESLKIQNSQNEQVDVVFSLRFHLAKRKALNEIGYKPPFYLIKEKGIF
jgi:hypothetical protein